MKTFSLEKVMRVYDDSEGVYIEVSQNPDFPDSGIMITTNQNKESKMYYGDNNILLNDKDQVIKLAHALLEMAEQIKD